MFSIFSSFVFSAKRDGDGAGGDRQAIKSTKKNDDQYLRILKTRYGISHKKLFCARLRKAEPPIRRRKSSQRALK
jgi:hypothetical protein